MPLDLDTVAPDDLAFRISLKEVLEAIRGRKQWSPRMALVLDYAYCERLLQLVRTGASLEPLRELNEHLALVVHPRRREQLQELGKPYFERWTLLYELTEMRLESLRSEVPAQVLKRKHVREILERLQQEGELSQQRLGEEFELGEANLSRILGLMEANELIDKVPRGNSNNIILGVRGRELMPPKAAVPHRAPESPPAPRPSVTSKRGLDFLDYDSMQGTFGKVQ